MKKIIFTLLVTALACSASARAETVNCTAITALPYIITTQGVYCLIGPLNTNITTGNAITINTNNVVVDLNGFKLGGLAAGPGTNAFGIYALERQNVTIKNGTVRGFKAGIFFEADSPYATSQGHVIQDILADQNTVVGIQVEGKGNVIRGNQVVGTGGSTLLGVNAYAFGIGVAGPGAQVLENMVTQVTGQGTGSANGIELFLASSSVVAGNRIGNLSSPSGPSNGILLESGTGILVRGNNLTGMQFGIKFELLSTGKYFGNMTDSITTPYTGGTAAGTSNF